MLSRPNFDRLNAKIYITCRELSRLGPGTSHEGLASTPLNNRQNSHGQSDISQLGHFSPTDEVISHNISSYSARSKPSQPLEGSQANGKLDIGPQKWLMTSSMRSMRSKRRRKSMTRCVSSSMSSHVGHTPVLMSAEGCRNRSHYQGFPARCVSLLLYFPDIQLSNHTIAMPF